MEIIKEYIALDTCNKSRIYVDIECLVCGTVFSKQKRFLSNVNTCSSICLSINNGTRVFVQCATCGVRFSKAISKANLSKSGLHFCTRLCKDTGQSYIKEIQPGHYGTGQASYRQRAIKKYGAICNRCGYNENIAAIVVHHKDRIRENNDIANLEVLCSNCRSIEHLDK